MLKKFKIINNLDIKPTFDVKEITVLKNDCLDYLDLYNGQTEDFHESDPYLKKNCFALVLECGLSKYILNQNGEILNPGDNTEWCAVQALVNDPPEGFDIDVHSFNGLVKATDLRLLTVKDLEEMI